MDFVALEIIRQLQKIDTVNQYYIMVAPGEDVCLEPSANVRIVEVKCPTYPLWEQVALPLAVNKIKPDLLHCTSDTAPLFCHVPLVLTLHDIIYLEPRQHTSLSAYQNLGWYYRRFIVPKILTKCHKIITVSHFECHRIRETLHLDASKILTIYNGLGSHFIPVKKPASITKKYLSEENYLFFLGNTDPKKNTERTLKAYGLYVQQTTDPLPLLIADLQESDISHVLENIRMPFLKTLIRCPGYITNTDLPAIYSGAKVFLYTSLRESFGIPLLEAMACGTPVITSNTSSMPEVAGNAAIFTNPTDENDITAQLIRLLKDKKIYKEYITRGLERVKVFSWENTARATFRVYQDVYLKNGAR